MRKRLSHMLPARLCSATLSHQRHDFRGEKLLKTKCLFLFSLQLLSETLLIRRRIERDMIKKCILVFM